MAENQTHQLFADIPGRRPVTLADITGEVSRSTGRIERHGPRHERHVARRRSGLKFDWLLSDHAVSPHRAIASGRAWTRRGAWRQLNRAYHRELDRIAAERAGLRDRLAHAEDGCE